MALIEKGSGLSYANIKRELVSEAVALSGRDRGMILEEMMFGGVWTGENRLIITYIE
jgi:hypothetical protein